MCLEGQVDTQAAEVELVSALPTCAPIQMALCQPDHAGKTCNEDAPREYSERPGKDLGKVREVSGV